MVNQDFISAVSADYKLTLLNDEQFQVSKRKKNISETKWYSL